LDTDLEPHYPNVQASVFIPKPIRAKYLMKVHPQLLSVWLTDIQTNRRTNRDNNTTSVAQAIIISLSKIDGYNRSVILVIGWYS